MREEPLCVSQEGAFALHAPQLLEECQSDDFRVRKPPEERDRAYIAAALGKTAGNLALLDAHLAGRDYVTGPSLTMADIPLGVTAYRWFALDVE